MRYKAAAVQFDPKFMDRAGNTERLAQLVTQAAATGARLVVLPEMAAVGYCFVDRQEVSGVVEHVPDGPTVRTFADLAATLGIYIVVGLPEVEPSTGAFYNTAVLLGPQGYIGQYRKTHAFMDDTRWARDGNLGIPVFDTDLGRIAILICMDADYFEPARVAALSGADVIAFPANWLGSRLSWRARASENGCYMVCANRPGDERGVKFAGHSAIIDPNGTVLDELAMQNGVAVAEIDTDLARTARGRALALRRPEEYQDLLLSSYLWYWRNLRNMPEGRPVVVAAGSGTEAAAMADQVRLADKQARDQEMGGLDLMVFPLGTAPANADSLWQTARELNCYLVWGSTEPSGVAATYLVGPAGLMAQERTGATGNHPEERFAVHDLPWGRIGLLTGADLLLPEPCRILAKRAADLIAVPAAWESQETQFLWSVRSFENDTGVVVANALGGSGIFAPGYRGENRPVGGIVVGVVNTGLEKLRCKEMLRKLQPRWYDPLVSR
ncbi:MAG: nitrilase-related carbon-nitrogen hydrolase [Mycobacterium leprae]